MKKWPWPGDLGHIRLVRIAARPDRGYSGLDYVWRVPMGSWTHGNALANPLSSLRRL